MRLYMNAQRSGVTRLVCLESGLGLKGEINVDKNSGVDLSSELGGETPKASRG